MRLLILAAGYATRLYPLTLNQPKPLLEVGGKPMLNHILDHLLKIKQIDQVYIVTNEKFVSHFENWAASYDKKGAEVEFKIINDGSTSDENKLGAIGDMSLVIDQEGLASSGTGLMVAAGDNLFDKSLEGFGTFCEQKNAPCEAVYDVGDYQLVKKYNSISVDEESRITFFEEKSQDPKSTLTGIALYYYPEHVIPRVKEYIEAGNNPDQPGRFIQWLYKQEDVYTWKVPGTWYDIGGKESLEAADKEFSEKANS